jgi:hypothetical protein
MTGRRVAFGRCIGEKTLTLQANIQLGRPLRTGLRVCAREWHPLEAVFVPEELFVRTV